MTEEEVEKKSKAIIEEYLHINDSKVPMAHCSRFGLVFFLIIWQVIEMIVIFSQCRRRYSVSQSSTVPHCFLCLYGVALSRPLNVAPSPENIWGDYCTTL